MHTTEAGLTDAAAAGNLQLLPAPTSSNSSGSAARLLVPAHVLLAFQPTIMGSSSRSFAAPEHWMVLVSCHQVAAALRVDARGCGPVLPAALTADAYAAARNLSSAEVLQRYSSQGPAEAYELVFRDAPWRPAGLVAACLVWWA